MSGEEQNAIWPLPKFSFQVDINGVGDGMAFQEVSGLQTETEVIEYRAGNSKVYSNVKMPGLAKYSNVTLTKGVFTSDNKLFDWYNEISMNTILRRSVTIKLMDENGEPQVVYNLINAWPVKITGTDLNAMANEVAIETLEIAHEGLRIESP